MTAAVRPAAVGMRSDKFGYFWNGSARLPRVTSILKLQDTFDFADWAAGEVADYLIDAWQRGQVPDWGALRSAAFAFKNRKRDLGSAVHEQISDLHRGVAFEPTADTQSHLNQYARFLAQHSPRMIEQEQVVLSPTMGYAGRFDFIAEIGGRICLVDIKTGSVHPSHRLQLAAYSEADFIGREGDDTEYALPVIEDYYLLLLRPDTYEFVQQRVGPAERAHWARLVETYKAAKAWEAA